MYSRRRFAPAVPGLLLVTAVVVSQLGGLSAHRPVAKPAGKPSFFTSRSGEAPVAVARVHLRGVKRGTVGRVTCTMSRGSRALASGSKPFSSSTRPGLLVRIRGPRAGGEHRLRTACRYVVRRGTGAGIRARSRITYPLAAATAPRHDRIAEGWYDLPEGHTPESTSTIELDGLDADSTGTVTCTMTGGGREHADSVAFDDANASIPITIFLTGESITGPARVLVTCSVAARNTPAGFTASGETETFSMPAGGGGMAPDPGSVSEPLPPVTHDVPQVSGELPAVPAPKPSEDRVEPGTLLPDGTREPGRRDNGDGTVTVVTPPMTPLEATRETLSKQSRFHEAPDGRVQVIHGSTLLPTGVGTLQADGTRVIGARDNGDGTITVVYPKIGLSQKAQVTLGPKDRFHEVPGGRYVQLIRGSTIV